MIYAILGRSRIQQSLQSTYELLILQVDSYSTKVNLSACISKTDHKDFSPEQVEGVHTD